MLLGSSIPYNESELVGLITDLYKLLIRLNHYTEEEIIFPPPGGHVLDTSRLTAESRIDVRLMSLMQNLPVPSADLCKYIAPSGMQPVCYVDPIALALSRDINKTTYWAPPGALDQSNALPTVLLLFEGQDPEEASLVLDIADSESPFLSLLLTSCAVKPSLAKTHT